VIIPVYMSIPHQKLADQRRLEIGGVAKSFQIKRHYVEVPEGTTLVRVAMEVPESSLEDGVVSGCSGVSLTVLEAGNTSRPPEFADRNASIARSCSDSGVPTNGSKSRRVVFERFAPTPGIWDLHVMGRYNFVSSAYALSVDYANLESTKTVIEGDVAALNGSFEFSVGSSSFEVLPSAENSSFVLQGLRRAQNAKVRNGGEIEIPNAQGEIFRSFDAGIASVTFQTSGAKGTDIDLEVFACKKKSKRACEVAGSSGSATDEESATVEVKPELFYLVVVKGFRVPMGETDFLASETLSVTKPDKGTIALDPIVGDPSRFAVGHGLAEDQSEVLKRSEFTSGLYEAVGRLSVRSESSALLLSLGVSITPQIVVAE
jgi:hypothetical protein